MFYFSETVSDGYEKSAQENPFVDVGLKRKRGILKGSYIKKANMVLFTVVEL